MYGGVGGYGYHDRYKGFPWRGEQHTNQTWPITFQRDSGLEAKAQAEAERINAGGTPKGEQRSGLYLDGVDTANYIIACKELDSTSMGKEGPPMSKNWGTARLAIHYHDAGGDGPVITKIGIGAVDAGEGHTWWVLWYAE
ncbi:MAG: hypothetical protein E3J72_16800 [Planctomycetota bacterium]|nr:MAG: hypothetical protein E3J72_16800 [Planctomycetota bacterium]